MRLLDELRAEHATIDEMLGALRTYVEQRVAGTADERDAASFVAFFRLYADRFHHAREEAVLFPALAEQAELPAGHGPLAVLEQDHERMRAVFRELASLLGAAADDASARRLSAVAIAYSRALWVHIDAENSVLFPESEARLADAGVFELPTRAPTEEEAGAAAEAARLVRRYPPTVDRVVIRGEGCVVCPSYGVTCRGLEHEWWSENEWEEAPDRFG